MKCYIAEVLASFHLKQTGLVENDETKVMSGGAATNAIFIMR